MKKFYEQPEVEVIKFSVDEEVMTSDSGTTVTPGGSPDTGFEPDEDIWG